MNTRYQWVLRNIDLDVLVERWRWNKHGPILDFLLLKIYSRMFHKRFLLIGKLLRMRIQRMGSHIFGKNLQAHLIFVRVKSPGFLG